MKLRIASDLHLEHGHVFTLPVLDFEDQQTLILAGDISEYYYLMDHFLKDCANRFKYVILIYGNHEYYRKNVIDAKRDFSGIVEKFNNVYLLDNDFITLDGVRFFGGTLWTKDYFKYDNNFTDFSLVKNHDNFHYKEYLDFMNKLSEWPDHDVDVVISHHLPSIKSADLRFANHPFNKYFINELDDFIYDWKNIKYWIHGHTHKSHNYKIGNCNVICNPKGYDDENPTYNPTLIHEIK